LLLAAGQPARVDVPFRRQANALEQHFGLADRLARRHAKHANRRLRDVLERGLVREEVEALEDHPDLRSLSGDRALVVLDQPAVLLPVADELPVDLDPAGVDLLQVG
jgi:hypothetical protein